MALESRNLEVGTRLVGRYKKQDYSAEVVQAEDGSMLYRLSDGREFKSLSAAGSAVMGGVPCNGWRFWSLAEGEVRAEAKAQTNKKPKARKARQKEMIIRRTESQDGVAEGSVRYFCAACLDSFVVEGGDDPECCPAGHRVEPETLVVGE